MDEGRVLLIENIENIENRKAGPLPLSVGGQERPEGPPLGFG